jgi:hypothetical protein
MAGIAFAIAIEAAALGVAHQVLAAGGSHFGIVRLVRPVDRHDHAVERLERAQPNELWQMDFESRIGWQAPTGPRSVIDDHSRYGIVLPQTGSTGRSWCRNSCRLPFRRTVCQKADGARHSLVEFDGGGGSHGAEPVADEAGHGAALDFKNSYSVIFPCFLGAFLSRLSSGMSST